MFWPRGKPKTAAPDWQPAQPGGFPTLDEPALSGTHGFFGAMERATGLLARHLETAGAAADALGGASSSASQPFPDEGPTGHRARMRDRLLDRGPDSLADYELLEMLLFLVQPKGDTKRVAKRLINRFGSYAATLSAEQRDLLAVEGVGRHTVAAIKLAHGSALRLARAELLDRSVVGNWDQLMGYLKAVLGHEPVEQFRLLFLDTKNHLIADELQNRGTINHAPVYPREVAVRALELKAAAVILVHNHPSGDPTPSEPDVEMTMRIESALTALGVNLHDHVIVGRGGAWSSMRKQGLL